MNYVKRKGSNAGKTTPSQFGELKAEFLADIRAEVIIIIVYTNRVTFFIVKIIGSMK